MTAKVVIESGFSWLDHRDEDAQRAREVLKALDEGTTVDSIGIGTVRDAMADVLFPATSTLHTRGRYYLFLPWIYRSLEAERVPSSAAAQVGREREIRLTYALLAGCADGEQGIIGREARERLKQLPRIVYWNGTAAMGIRRFPGSIRQYFQSLDGFYRRTRREVGKEDDADAGGRAAQNWDLSLPEPPDGWEDEVSLALTTEESLYLVDRAQTSLSGTLFAELLGRGQPLDTDFPWTIDRQDHLPDAVRRALGHARWFSETIHGAQLLYNLMIAERVAQDGGDAGQVEHYREWFDEWAVGVDTAAEERRLWDRQDFWSAVLQRNPRIPQGARSLVDGWLTAVDAGAAGLADDTGWRDHIERREFALKKGLARLRNRRARELWGGGSGAGQLNFRWPQASTAISDIAEGLGAGS